MNTHTEIANTAPADRIALLVFLRTVNVTDAERENLFDRIDTLTGAELAGLGMGV